MKIPTITYAAIKLWHQAQEVSYVPVVYCYGLSYERGIYIAYRGELRSVNGHIAHST
ncbi:hypothetical protein APHNYW_0177 [Anaplasma phagocytophilum str. ApNYW]|nr:hypothetical protein APHNYW_0177 [Anaplasma phagocytophilum str. ApNYW]